MFSRRQILLASGGAVAAASSLSPESSAASVRSAGSSGDGQPHLQTAAACVACSQACTVASRDLAVDAKSLSEDCRDLCMVTATVLSRRGPLGPAVVQACADACDRMAAACKSARQTANVSECVGAAQACAAACRRLLRIC